MPFYYTAYLILPLLAALVNGVLAIYTWKHRHVPAARWLFLVLVGFFGHSCFYVLKTAAIGLELKIVFNYGIRLFISIYTACVPLLVLAVLGQERLVTRRNILLLSTIPCLTAILTWSTRWHGLVQYNFHLVSREGILLLELSHGPWYWVNLFYCTVEVAVAALACFVYLFRVNRARRTGILLVLLGILIPMLVEVTQVSPLKGFQMTSSAFLLSGLCYWLGVFRHHLLDLVPMARKTFFEEMNEPALVLTPQSSLASTNKVAGRLFGLTAASLGQTLSELFPSGNSWSGLATAAHNSVLHDVGHGTWWHLSRSELRRFDTLQGYLLVLRDITGQALAEEGLRSLNVVLEERKVAAEEASKAKSDFLALISHEIRTPLNSLVGFSALARRATDPLKLDQYHAILEQSSCSLMDLVNNILDMSKIEAGRLEFEALPFDLRQLVTTLEVHYRHVAAQKKLEFRLVMDDTVPSWVLGDPVRLRQILANLLSNAVKFTDNGGITCRVTSVDGSPQGSILPVRFELHDSGIGIPVTKQSDLFKPFQQLDPSISRKYGGSGLGLAIVRSLVLKMGGSIAVESREGVGSCFSVLLPLERSEPSLVAELVQPLSFAVGKVLVVEDNRYNRLLLEDLLKGWGQQVTLAEDGPQGLRLMEQQSFDLVLLDIRMPGMDGMEVARRVRLGEQERGDAPVPIIAITADADSATRDSCLQAGINGVLAKPLIPDQLARAIALQLVVSGGTSSGTEPLLTQRSREGIGSNPERIRTYREMLTRDIHDELHSLGGAVERNDREGLCRCAHTLKGLCGELTNREPAELALWLQQNGSSAPAERLGEVAAQLRTSCHAILMQEES